MSDSQKYEIRSEEVNDILSRTPVWLIRAGSVLLLCFVLLFIAGAALFKYPDVIIAPVVITSESLPAQLVAKRSGRIEEIFVKDGYEVKKGDAIAIVENAAEFGSYLQAKEACENFSDPNYSLPELTKLGDMQNTYSQFAKSVREYHTFLKLNYHGKMIEAVKAEIETKKDLKAIAERKKELLREQYVIAEKTYLREQALYNSKAISLHEYQKARTVFITEGRQLESANEDIGTYLSEIIRGEQSILGLQLDKEETLSRLQRAVDSDLSLLLSSITHWEQNNLFLSPVDGVVSFTAFWQENQNVSEGDIVFTVIPEVKSFISGKIYMPMAGAGKVKVGQKVNIKLESYPYMEYGMVQVNVGSVSLLPAAMGNSRVYIVSVDFPEGLITSYSVKLNFGEEMHGVAEIITDNSSLLRRVFNPFRHLVKTHL